MIFADTSALIALFNPKDDCHNKALEWFKENRPRLVLTDYIVDELLTLAISKGNKHFALEISRKIRSLFSMSMMSIEKISESDFNNAWTIFDSYDDKDWSLTDCTSYVYIKRSNVQGAFAFDSHFDQFGIVARQPS